jgi:hypothetical protein
MKGFSQQWCAWVERFVSGASVGIKINDDIGHYFQTKKGLRQGDLMSPILFNIVADMLSILIKRAKDDGQIKGVIPHLVDDRLSILQYADDTILFMDHDLEQAKNMKLLLCVFEQLSGLKINFHKSEIFCYGEAKHYEQEYTRLSGCGIGSFPFRYLGIPMNHRKLHNADLSIIEERFKRKLSTWKAKHLSYGGRLVLLNSVLRSLPMFMMSFFEIPKDVLKKLDYRSRFFWQGNNEKRKYRLAKWNILCRPKDQGGLGITDIYIKNKCLLSKWIFKLLNEEGIWQTLLRNKYLSAKCFTQAQIKPGDSHFWKGLLKVREDFLGCGTFKIKDGSQTRFWEDTWVGSKPLKEQFPSLFNIVHYPHDTMVNVMNQNPLNLSFRRALTWDKLTSWHNLVAKVSLQHLSQGRDGFTWDLH